MQHGIAPRFPFCEKDAKNINMLKQTLYILCALLAFSAFAAVAEGPQKGFGKNPDLPKPFATESARKFSSVVGWPDGVTPKAPAGFRVTLFAKGLDSPRWIYVLPNGDVLVSEARTGRKWIFDKSPDDIILLRDADGDGIAEVQKEFASGFNKPFGMTLLKDKFYVANMDGLLRFDYRDGDEKLKGSGEKLLDLPAGGYNHHWTRNVVAGMGGKKLYVSVGSASNVGEGGMEDEKRRAAILEINPDGSGERIFASGLRNPVGMAFEPETGALWTAVNERDKLGDDLVPDYFTSVKDGGFYGWPYFYFGKHPDPRWKITAQMEAMEVKAPDYALGAHTASLGLAFYAVKAFPDKYQGAAFIGQHGSWNRSAFAGYKVIFVPFKDGKPAGAAQDFLTGFIKDEAAGEVYGRPVGVAVAKDGSLLVADDAGNAIWRVAPEK